MSDTTVREIEMSMEMTKKKIRMAEVLERLEKNEDFKELIEETFLKEHALGMVTKQVSPSYQDPINKKYVKDQLIAVGGLRMFLNFVKQEGALAKDALVQAEEERARALEEANA